VDGESRFPVSARFKIYSKNNNKVYLGAPEDINIYHASLISNEEYVLEVKAPGYLFYTERFSLDAKKENKIQHKIIPLEKSSFMANLRAIDGISGDVVKDAFITLINTTSFKTIHTLVNPITGDCKADFDLDNEYKVDVNASGYLPYHEIYNATEKLASKDFILYPISSFSILNINVVEAVTKKSLIPNITIIDKENKEVPIHWKNDVAEAGIISGFVYKVRVEAEGYLYYEDSLYIESAPENNFIVELTASSTEEDKVPEEIIHESDLIFENIVPGQAVVLSNILFDQSKFTLKEASYVDLEKLLNTLKKNPQYKIIIAGHTDNRGDKKLNQLLSQNRANVIANYLIEKGIEEERLEVIGYGSSQPIAPNDSEENRMKNRRVEFRFQ
ncbi:MAG: OmpA family protein, partial [Bacteroidota bacterium]|nr:OmpA family protein [Bacteroidota bacterium]